LASSIRVRQSVGRFADREIGRNAEKRYSPSATLAQRRGRQRASVKKGLGRDKFDSGLRPVLFPGVRGSARPDGIFVAPFEQGEIGPDLFRVRPWRQQFRQGVVVAISPRPIISASNAAVIVLVMEPISNAVRSSSARSGFALEQKYA
jgi:hypothetical protein